MKMGPFITNWRFKQSLIKKNRLWRQQKEKEIGCFVLITNLEKDGENSYTAKEILTHYKEQYGVEKNFGFLKDDQIVNALFLKNPKRIEALGLILLISLLIARIIESQMRKDRLWR